MLDMIIIVIMIYLILRGIFRGFFMEVASLAGVVLGIIAGMQFHGLVAERLRPYIPSLDTFVLDMLSFAIIFAAFLVVCNLLGWLLKTIVKKIFLGWTDRGLGAALAIVKGIIVANLLIFVLNLFVPSDSPLMAKSRLAPVIKSSYQLIIGLISPDFYEKLKKTIPWQSKNADDTTPKKTKALTGKDGR